MSATFPPTTAAVNGSIGVRGPRFGICIRRGEMWFHGFCFRLRTRLIYQVLASKISYTDGKRWTVPSRV